MGHGAGATGPEGPNITTTLLPHAHSVNSSTSSMHPFQQARTTASYCKAPAFNQRLNPLAVSPDAHPFADYPTMLPPHAGSSNPPARFPHARQSTLQPVQFGQLTPAQRHMVPGLNMMDFATSQAGPGCEPFSQEPATPGPNSLAGDLTARSQAPRAYSGSCEALQENGLLVCFFLVFMRSARNKNHLHRHSRDIHVSVSKRRKSCPSYVLTAWCLRPMHSTEPAHHAAYPLDAGFATISPSATFL